MKNFFLTTLLLTFFTLPPFVFAQTEYTLLEPSVYNGTYNTTGGKPFSDYLNLVFKIGIGVAAGLAVIQIVIGGIQYMASESPFKIGDAKSKIEGAILGLILALGIYVFLYTINPDIVSLKLDIIKPPAGAPTSGVTTGAVSTPFVKAENKEQLEAILKDEDRVRALLKAANIEINNPPCQSYGQNNCTNVGLLPTSTISFLSTLKKACGGDCKIVISGGTEWWKHKTHGQGRPVVDIGKNSSGVKISEYIIKKGVETSTRANSNTCSKIGETCILFGGSFYNENDAHWHVRTP
ncbi:MAG: Uncharacterized protein LiPW30_198 [Parcubacteria group bacterium LiPW_30]|nr:MAG: Uncharacterized protein LiPW30_198 [Parcubacteria group bacterium LiPW_30]